MRLLDAPQGARRWTGWETGTLSLYVAVLCFGIAQHVSWADEAQAWMLAHHVSLGYLLTHSLHYEGTPGLWHILLMLLQQLHLSFTAARWVSGGIAGAGVAVLLAYAPFPRLIKLLLPFSFFLLYQDAVIARSYVLFAVLAFAAAAMLRSTHRRPLRLALVLGLMAQISIHGALVSGGLAIVAMGIWRKRRGRGEWPRTLGAAALILASWIVAIATMFPAPDIDYVAGNNVERSVARIEQQMGLSRKMPAPLSAETMAGLAPTLPAVHVRHGWQSTWNKLGRTLSIVTYPLSTIRILALLLVLLVAAQAWLAREGSRSRSETTSEFQAGPVGLTPYLLMVAVFTSLYLAPRHAGMVFTTFVVSAWLTWPVKAWLAGRRLLLQRVTVVVFALVLLVQVSWTYHAIRAEHKSIYSPDRLTADYLKQRGVGAPGGGKLVAGFYYYSVGPLLYFEHNIYFNQPAHRYWYWSTQMRNYDTAEGILARHPDLIVIGGYDSGPDAEVTRDWQPIAPPEPGVIHGDGFMVADYYRRRGYHETRLFCGDSWMRSTYAERICDTVLEPDPAK